MYVCMCMSVCVEIFNAYGKVSLLLWRKYWRAVTGLMDELGTDVDLAETESSYSFHLTGLHLCGEMKDVCEEEERSWKKSSDLEDQRLLEEVAEDCPVHFCTRSQMTAHTFLKKKNQRG